MSALESIRGRLVERTPVILFAVMIIAGLLLLTRGGGDDDTTTVAASDAPAAGEFRPDEPTSEPELAVPVIERTTTTTTTTTLPPPEIVEDAHDEDEILPPLPDRDPAVVDDAERLAARFAEEFLTRDGPEGPSDTSERLSGLMTEQLKGTMAMASAAGTHDDPPSRATATNVRLKTSDGTTAEVAVTLRRTTIDANGELGAAEYVVMAVTVVGQPDGTWRVDQLRIL